MGKAIAKIVLLGLLFVALVLVMGPTLTPQYSPYNRWEEFNELKENSVDILFIGNSHSYACFDPAIIDNKLGTNSFNLSFDANNLELCYYNLKEALKTQKPKIVVLELFALLPSFYSDTSSIWVYATLDGYSFSLNKMQAIASCRPPSDYIHCLFPSIRNHDNWKIRDSLLNDKNYYKSQHSNTRGFQPVLSAMDDNCVKEYDAGAVTDTLDYVHYKIDSLNEVYLKLFVELAKENNFSLVYTLAPTYYDLLSKEYKYKHAALLANADRNSIPFVDFNLLNNQLHYSSNCFENVVHKNQHISIDGALMSSAYLAEFIGEKYGAVLPNRRAEKEWIARMSDVIEVQLLHLNELGNSRKLLGSKVLTSKMTIESVYLISLKEPFKYRLVIAIADSFESKYLKEKSIYMHLYPDFAGGKACVGLDFSPVLKEFNKHKYIIQDFTAPENKIDSLHLGLCKAVANYDAIGKGFVLYNTAK